MSAQNLVSLARLHVGSEHAQTLIELVVVVSILGVILTPLATSFATSMRQEASQARRDDAQDGARSALSRMRLDIHCAHATTLPVQQNAYGGFTLTLPENPGQCPGVVAASSGVSGIEWCTIPYPESTTRFRLYRLNATSLESCSASAAATFMSDYISPPSAGWPTNAATMPIPTEWAGNIWPTADTCTAGSLPTIAVDLNVSYDPVDHPGEAYELTDRIAALNSDPC